MLGRELLPRLFESVLDDAADGIVPVLGLRGQFELDDRGSAPFEASTTTSDGPAGRSIATSRETIALRLVHVLVARADDQVDALDVSSVAMRDRLRSAKRPHLLEAERLGRRATSQRRPEA